jgi:AbrB family looped-hinge helix DNA binding protein
MPVVNSTAKGQIVIPKKVRERGGIKPGQRIMIKIVDNYSEIHPLKESSPMIRHIGGLKILINAIQR